MFNYQNENQIKNEISNENVCNRKILKKLILNLKSLENSKSKICNHVQSLTLIIQKNPDGRIIIPSK